MATIEAQIAESDDMTPLTDRKKELSDQIKANKEIVIQATVSTIVYDQILLLKLSFQADERQMNDAIKRCNESIKNLTQKIDEEVAKLNEDRQGKEEAILTKIKEQEDQLTRINDRARDIPNELRAQNDKKADLEKEGGRMKAEVDKFRKEIDDCDGAISQIHANARSELAKFGDNLEAVLQAVQAESWTGKAPLGPLGKFVTLKDAKWAPIFRVMLGSQMSSFVVENNADRQKLIKILQHFRWYIVPSFIVLIGR